MQLLQTLFALGLASVAMAELTGCNVEKAELTNYGRMGIACGGDSHPWLIDLDSCFVNNNGNLVYQKK